MTTAELSIKSILCPDRMLPSRSGTGAASVTHRDDMGMAPPRLLTPREEKVLENKKENTENT